MKARFQSLKRFFFSRKDLGGDLMDSLSGMMMTRS
jgi:hypothetical protein